VNTHISYLTIVFWQFNFHGIISSCFEPYMSVYIELEEKSLVDQLDKLIQEEKWETEEGSQTYILSSSMQVKGNCMVVNSLVFSRLASVG
jgi:hypothetical protein